jgi:hypothetical protein
MKTTVTRFSGMSRVCGRSRRWRGLQVIVLHLRLEERIVHIPHVTLLHQIGICIRHVDLCRKRLMCHTRCWWHRMGVIKGQSRIHINILPPQVLLSRSIPRQPTLIFARDLARLIQKVDPPVRRSISGEQSRRRLGPDIDEIQTNTSLTFPITLPAVVAIW